MTTSTCQSKQPKPCKKHGVVERNKNEKCKICAKEQGAKWKKQNPEKWEKWQKENAETLAKRNAEWQKNNINRVYKRIAEWRKENPFSDTMVKSLIRVHKPFVLCNLTNYDIPPELVEIKRLQMQLHRAIKQRELNEKQEVLK
ncbi:MAG: hypothetical protein RL755_37 [Pseudomonadota bacterium]|jgi:hypothetical protein